MIGLLLFIFIDALKDTVHLLLKQQFELLNHEFIDRAPLDEVSDQALNSIALVHNDALDSEVCHVNIDVQLGFTFFTSRWFLFGALVHCVCKCHRTTRLIAINRRCSGIVADSSDLLLLLHDFGLNFHIL